MRAVLLAVLLATACPVAAEIYKCPGANGKVEFTDKPCAAGTKVTVQPNSIGAQDQSGARKKREAVDKRISEKVAADAAENERLAESRRAKAYECQTYIDAAERQRAWLSSESDAIRQSAANEIEIQRRRFRDARCG